MQPTVSVIIPTFNCAAYLTQAIDSALHQTHVPEQVIVIDDGSTDHTPSILERYGPRIEVIRQLNAGVPAARNAGLRIARGEWIALLDADDAWHPHKLELQLAALARLPTVGVIGTRTIRFPDVDWPALNVLRDAGSDLVPLTSLLVHNCLTASSVMVHRDVVERVGEFDKSVPGVEDIDYWQRAAEFTQIANLRARLTGYRTVPGSLSRRAQLIEAGLRRVLRKLDQRDSWNGQRWLRRKAISHFHYGCAHLHGTGGDQWAALVRMIKSLAWYPLPFSADEIAAPFARPKRTLVVMLRLLGWLPPDHGLVDGRRS